MHNFDIPEVSSFKEEKYYLKDYFISKILDSNAIFMLREREGLRDSFEKEILLALKSVAIKEDEEESLSYDYSSFKYYDAWWELFKLQIIFPYIKSLGLEKTWLSDIFGTPLSKTFSYTVQRVKHSYWTLVVAPPSSNVYSRAVLDRVIFK